MRRIDGRRLAVDLLVDVASGLLVGASTYQFAYAANFAPGGLVGLTLILYHLTGFPMGWATLLLNIPIVLVSWRVMGVGFLLRSLKTMVVASLVLDYVLPHVPVFTGPAWLSCVMTGVLAGVGYGIVFARGSSTGGTDFLIVPLNRLFPRFSLGRILFVVDGVVILLAAVVFSSWLALAYGLIATLLTTLLVDGITRALQRRGVPGPESGQ